MDGTGAVSLPVPSAGWDAVSTGPACPSTFPSRKCADGQYAPEPRRLLVEARNFGGLSVPRTSGAPARWPRKTRTGHWSARRPRAPPAGFSASRPASSPERRRRASAPRPAACPVHVPRRRIRARSWTRLRASNPSRRGQAHRKPYDPEGSCGLHYSGVGRTLRPQRSAFRSSSSETRALLPWGQCPDASATSPKTAYPTRIRLGSLRTK